MNKYLSLINFFLAFLAVGSVYAEQIEREITLYSDERETFVEFPGIRDCEILNDDTTNFTVDVTSATGFSVAANGVYKRDAMLLILCKDKEHVFQMSFKNTPKNQIDDYNSILKRPDSFVRLDSTYASSGLWNAGLLLHDHSLRAFKMTAFRNYRDIENPDWHSTGFNFTHNVANRISLGYGSNKSYFEDEVKDSHNGWLNVYGASLFLQRGYNNQGENRFDLSFIFPSPILVRYRYLRDYDFTLTRSLSRAFFIALHPNFAQRILFTYSFINPPFTNDLIKKSEVENRFFIQPIYGVNLVQQTNGFCLSEENCKINFINVSSRLRMKNFVGNPEYGIYPHYAALDLAYRFSGNQEVGIYYKKPFAQLDVFKDKAWIETVDDESESTFNTTVKLEYRYSQNFFSLVSTVPTFPSESRDEAYLSLQARHEGDTMDYGAGVSGRPFKDAGGGVGFTVFVKKHFEENLKYLNEKISTHELMGKVVLKSTQEALMNVSVTLYELKDDYTRGKRLKSTNSNRFGMYRIKDIPVSGQFVAVFNYNGVDEEVRIYKDREEIQLNRNAEMDDFVSVNVEVYLDMNDNGQLDKNDRKVAIPFYSDMVNEALVDIKNAKYTENGFTARRGTRVRLKIKEELIPSPYKFKKFFPSKLDLINKKYQILYILLERPK